MLEYNGFTIDNKILKIIKKDYRISKKDIDNYAPFGRDSLGRCYCRGHAEAILSRENIAYFKKIVKDLKKINKSSKLDFKKL